MNLVRGLRFAVGKPGHKRVPPHVRDRDVNLNIYVAYHKWWNHEFQGCGHDGLLVSRH